MQTVASSNVPAAGGGAAAQTPQFASLYVGDLDPEVTEAMLYEIFNTVGPVASIRVCRDSVTRRSLGYAYVNFHSAADAERVMDTLNYSTIKGRSCRIMWSHRDPNLRKTGNGNVFVKNLDKNVDNKALYDTFSLFGNILSCKVAADMCGKSRGYGFVHYETAEAAKQAIEKVNNMQIGEKTVYVGEFVPRDARQPQEVVNFTNIYVKNFPQDWDDARLIAEFKRASRVDGEEGNITSHTVEQDKKGRKFAFINFEKPEMAKAAIESMHKKDCRAESEKVAEDAGDLAEGGYLMYVSRAMTKAERALVLKSESKTDRVATPVGVNLYIKNLPDDCDDAGLKEMFAAFGEITSARVMQDTKARSKGFGFVCYKTPDEATKAVTEMHLKTVKGKPLYVGLAEKKEERTSRLAARYKGDKGGKGGLVTFDSQLGKQAGSKGAGLYQTPAQGAGQVSGMKGQMLGMNPSMMGGMGQPTQMMRGGLGMNGMMRYPMMQGKMPMMQMQMGKPMSMGQQMQMQMGKGGGPIQPMQKGSAQHQQLTNMVVPDRVEGGGGLTAQMLANAPPGMQKQMLGEKLYPAVARLQPELAGKITGMMLEMDNSELLMMLESETQLRQKVDEAMRVLQAMK